LSLRLLICFSLLLLFLGFLLSLVVFGLLLLLLLFGLLLPLPLLLEPLRALFLSLGLEEPLRYAAGGEGPAADPGAKLTAEVIVALAEALDLAVGSGVVIGQASLGVAVARGLVGDDADRGRRGF